MHVIDTFVLYKFIRKLSTPFKDWRMYKAGVIDEYGNFLQSKDQRTPDQLASYSYLDVLILNLKKMLSKVPGGSSRIATFAAALYLLREGRYNNGQMITEQKFEEYLAETRSILYEDGEGGVPVNNIGDGAVADNPKNMNIPKKILKRHRLKESQHGPIVRPSYNQAPDRLKKMFRGKTLKHVKLTDLDGKKVKVLISSGGHWGARFQKWELSDIYKNSNGKWERELSNFSNDGEYHYKQEFHERDIDNIQDIWVIK